MLFYFCIKRKAYKECRCLFIDRVGHFILSFIMRILQSVCLHRKKRCANVVLKISYVGQEYLLFNFKLYSINIQPLVGLCRIIKMIYLYKQFYVNCARNVYCINRAKYILGLFCKGSSSKSFVFYFVIISMKMFVLGNQ